MSRTISRLIRFLAIDNSVYFGDAILPNGVTDSAAARSARIVTGDIFGDYQFTDQILEVKKLLSPLNPSQVRTIRCLGFNYGRHAIERGLVIDKSYKPVTSLSGPTDPIKVPLIAQDRPGLDYEAELVIVIGKQARDVPEADALDYVFGYTVGNDVSQRYWQVNGGGGQWNFGKCFDTWAPIGPAIVTKAVIGDPGNLKISCKINNEQRQYSNTSDFIFKVQKIVSFLSSGTTLLPGDLIFTGTPEGVGVAFSPPKWLEDGDIVETEIKNIGSIVNQISVEVRQSEI
ncbi:Fumarylacetoacetate hydrolase domain-containing protein 2 [Neolecta irregularis DAH-3]|uniref:Fumarylacetoacetate hydrolase domain-containing protein 2 n=1 Tax=Neolecta irregularis (strain DAH-3) TaxID=1198029 RepID=A0A1U7LRT7_NEOID|nr:Fumarylacetoacetate hydrolase domain-containing protein 2 [Neolecta irregularis DAH-3]|eukprot:OLL25262.1 Fumarylacetoacetate hydrolase domain-containing protein 2 [Neolecta irregularis DAH-3]